MSDDLKDDMFSDRLDRVLRKLLPIRMAEDLSNEGAEDTDFIADQLLLYLTTDETSKKEMALFHDGDGLEKIKDAIDKAGDPPKEEPEPPFPWSLN